MEFSPLIKGTPDWNEKYNQDIGGLCAEMDAARSSGILNTYVHTKSGTAHTLTGEGAIMRFTATAGWAAGDTISVNGLGKNPVTLEGTALPAGAFAQGTQVVAVVDGENLQFLTQSYAGQFDAISTQMSNKADKNGTLQSNLYAQYARDVQAPNLDITPETLFNDPPLNKMAGLDHRTTHYARADKPAGSPPTPNDGPEHWDVLTSTINRTRALRIATQCFKGSNNGRAFLQTRHWDTDEFAEGWQAWREVATCYCADLEWKPLPMINGWTNAVDFSTAAPKYRKGADGKVVYVRGYIKRTGDLTEENRTIAYLPEGYRPTGEWWSPTSHEYRDNAFTLKVSTNGRVYLTTINSNVQEIANWALPICLTIPV